MTAQVISINTPENEENSQSVENTAEHFQLNLSVVLSALELLTNIGFLESDDDINEIIEIESNSKNSEFDFFDDEEESLDSETGMDMHLSMYIAATYYLLDFCQVEKPVAFNELESEHSVNPEIAQDPFIVEEMVSWVIKISSCLNDSQELIAKDYNSFSDQDLEDFAALEAQIESLELSESLMVAFDSKIVE